MSAVGLRPRRVGHSAVATIVIPDAWHVADPHREPIAEATRLASTWPELAGRRVGTTELIRGLAITLERSRVAGASLVAVLSGDGGTPIAASLIVADLAPRPYTVTELELAWHAAGHDQVERVSLPAGPAAVSTRTTGLDDDALAELAGLPIWELQAAVPHPIAGGLLVTVSTPLVPVAHHLERVARAIVSTIRWQRH